MTDYLDFESDADREGFVQLPNVVLMDAGITMQGRLLYALLLHYARKDKSCYPGQQTLGGILGVCDRSIRDYVAELERQMLVRRESRGLGHTTRYLILALGLRPKRLEAARVSPEAQFRRKRTSGLTGTVLPGEVDAGEVDAVVSGRVPASKLKIAGKPVNAKTWDRTVSALAAFNAQADKKLAAITGTGAPSEAAKRVYGRLAAWPDVAPEQIADVIRRTLSSKWWGSDPPSIGVVFGPKVFEENLSRSGDAPRSASHRSDDVDTLLAMAERMEREG